MRTMHELRIDVRDKVPELEARLEMYAREKGFDLVRLSPEEMESYYDGEANLRCHFVLLACDAWRPWLYNEGGYQLSEYESELLDWLQVVDTEDYNRTYRDIDQAVKDFPTEVQDCNRLLLPILAAGRAKGLEEEDLFEYAWLMMSPFLSGQEQAPTEADWHEKMVELNLRRAVKADDDRHYARQHLERFIRESLAKDPEYTLSLLLGILAEVKDPMQS
jgi:hypothetical protein